MPTLNQRMQQRERRIKITADQRVVDRSEVRFILCPLQGLRQGLTHGQRLGITLQQQRLQLHTELPPRSACQIRRRLFLNGRSRQPPRLIERSGQRSPDLHTLIQQLLKRVWRQLRRVYTLSMLFQSFGGALK